MPHIGSSGCKGYKWLYSWLHSSMLWVYPTCVKKYKNKYIGYIPHTFWYLQVPRFPCDSERQIFDE